MNFNFKKYVENMKISNIMPGDKIFCEGYRSCLKMKETLSNSGIKTRICCNEAGMWNVYIISIPCGNTNVSIYDGCGIINMV